MTDRLCAFLMRGIQSYSTPFPSRFDLGPSPEENVEPMSGHDSSVSETCMCAESLVE